MDRSRPFGIEHWIRFGHETGETILDRRRCVLSLAPNSVFAFLRWASNDFSAIISRVDVVRAVDHGAPYRTPPFVRPGGDIRLRITGWPKVERPRRTLSGAASVWSPDFPPPLRQAQEAAAVRPTGASGIWVGEGGGQGERRGGRP